MRSEMKTLYRVKFSFKYKNIPGSVGRIVMKEDTSNTFPPSKEYSIPINMYRLQSP